MIIFRIILRIQRIVQEIIQIQYKIITCITIQKPVIPMIGIRNRIRMIPYMMEWRYKVYQYQEQMILTYHH